uniref:Uncharacterized protein n=1 Tax=Anguilla anguilla TaxID=7936 RepID=A0A0E9VJ82_ANGAN
MLNFVMSASYKMIFAVGCQSGSVLSNGFAPAPLQ